MLVGITRLGMKNFLWIYWLYEAFPAGSGFPVNASTHSENDISNWSTWEYQSGYVGGSLIVLAMVSALLGCLCCRRERRTQGFKEFKDGSTAGSETIIERGLELEVARTQSINVQFEPLTVERFVPESKVNPKPPSPLIFDDKAPTNDDEDPLPSRKWFTPGLHVPRERLKYLREIGRGWFGKIVEGTQDLDPEGPVTRGVVVRILTEEASTSERAWFLGEALPYLKLHHRNLLALFGACLETDPYLLLFEACPTGDLKAFLRSNKASTALMSENMPLRMALDVLCALDHMHGHGFAHTDLSARNCLIAADLSAKLGDYGIGVEKYPGDYYVVGDRALPIRWSAPESLICTDTTIETRAITYAANIWSFGILLWEIANWGERPYDTLSDEQVIEMILDTKFHDNLTLNHLENDSETFSTAIEACATLEPQHRASLNEISKILRGNKLTTDFDERWQSLRSNVKEPLRSLSLQELDTSVDSDFWRGVIEDKPYSTPQPRFKLGPQIIGDSILTNPDMAQQGSGSETEEESWRGRVERGAYTEKVKQKSKSVADLMVLVHIDSDSEAEWSLGPQTAEKPAKKRLPASGSVGDLRDSVLADEFNEALQKLRNPSKQSRQSPENENIMEKYTPECTSTPKIEVNNPPGNFVDVERWKNALEFELERKIPGFDLESMDFDRYIAAPSTSLSAPDTPQSRAEDLSADNEDLSNGEDGETERQRLSHDEEEDRKHLSTPDDERSSDSGFRDKESCEEEENPVPGILPHTYSAFPAGLSASAEEEQLKVLFELDTILDAEDCGSLEESEMPLSPGKIDITLLKEEEEQEQLSTAEENNRLDDIFVDKSDRNVNCIFKDNEESSERTQDPEESNMDTVIEIKEQEIDNDDEDSSTMSLRSDNSYVSFNLDEEFVAAIRNELREKLPRAQMAVVESQELRDGSEPSVNEVEAKAWEDDEESGERSSGTVDITIRYNVFGTPLSPILEERESAVNSESVGDTSITSKLSETYEDLLVVDTRTNKVMLVDGAAERLDDEDLTDEESMECGSNGVLNRLGQIQGRIGAPLPSPEEESKWQAQFPIPLQLQDDLMSTSFSTEHDWDSQDEDDEGGGDDGAPDDEEENSSSSGEFVWKRYNDAKDDDKEQEESRDYKSSHGDIEDKIDEEEGEDSDDEEEEFTPSAWDATLAPHRSALRSPEKALKAGDQKKNVWFKKQRYHCVYEYPKETPLPESQDQASTTWEPTSYADWEEMMESPKIDVYSMDYDESAQGDGEFFVSSGNRPFHFQVGDGKYVSQFFPGATSSAHQTDLETINQLEEIEADTKSPGNNQQQSQLGELRHTRDRLKLNLPLKINNSESPINSTLANPHDTTRSELEDVSNDTTEDSRTETKENSSESSISKDDESSIISIIRSSVEESSLENLPKEDLKIMSTNGESNVEISESEISTVKSLRRPLTIPSDETINKQIRKLPEFIPSQSTIVEAQIAPLTIAENKLEDENKSILSKIDCVLKSNETDVEESTNSVLEST